MQPQCVNENIPPSCNNPTNSINPANPQVNACWSRLEQFLLRLYNIDESLDSWLTPELSITLYTLVFEFCANKHEGADTKQQVNIQGAEIYQYLNSFTKQLLESIGDSIGIIGQNLIQNYLNYWERYCLAAVHVESIFHYLDRFWVTRECQEGRQTLHIYPLLWKLWDEQILIRFEHRFFEYIDRCLSSERVSSNNEGSMIVDPDNNIQKVIRSYHLISIIPKESLLFGSSQKYTCSVHPFSERLLPWYCSNLEVYCKEYSSLMISNELNGSLIANNIYKFWFVELQRVQSYLIGVSMETNQIERRVKEILKNSLILPVMNILNSLLKESIFTLDDPSSIISTIYELCSLRRSLLSNTLTAFEEGFYSRLCGRVPRVIKNKDQGVMLISMLYAMYLESRKIISQSMKEDHSMELPFDNAIKTFITNKEAKTTFAPHISEYLSRWIDHQIRENYSFNDQQFTFILLVLKFCEDKETFRKCYSQHLAQRLLFSTSYGSSASSHNREVEESILERLSLEYGNGFISNFKRMINDIELSRQLNGQIQTKLKRTRIGYEFSCRILSAGCWPFERNIDDGTSFDLSLKSSLDSFTNSYNEKHNGRKLYWSPLLTTAEVTFYSLGRNYSIIMSAAQYFIISALKCPLTELQLTEICGLSPSTVHNSLQLLLQTNLVTRGHNDTLSLNGNFSHPNSSFKVTHHVEIDQSDPTEQAKDTIEDRSLFIQSRIVKYMKRVKQCELSNLREELDIDAKEFTKALDLLKEKEYILIEDTRVEYIP